MESKTPGYRALPFIFSIVLIFVGYLLNNWYRSARETVSTEFDPSVYFVYAVVAPLLFALICLLLFATVFNQRLTLNGSLILLAIGLFVGLLPVWLFFTRLALIMPNVISTPYLPLAGAIVAVCGFAGLIFRAKAEKPAAIGG
ncbi:MAG TPA: hypothetical protein VIH16_02755 [Bellilinea sp.]